MRLQESSIYSLERSILGVNLTNLPYILENGSNDNAKESSVGPLLPDVTINCQNTLPR